VKKPYPKPRKSLYTPGKEFSVLNFEVSSVRLGFFRKPIPGIFIGFRTPLLFGTASHTAQTEIN